MTVAAFDEEAARRINRAREEYLKRAVPLVQAVQPLRTTIDVGCGFGFFTRTFLELGLEVTAVDGRAENVREAERRNPAASFAVHNVEDQAIRALGKFDLVVCLGLLYHLENPFAAVRNLAALTDQVLVAESVCAPLRTPSAMLYEEDHDIDQGLDYIALIPSEAWLVKVMYHCEFEHVYRALDRPDHPYFRASVTKRRRRTILIASRSALPIGGVERVDEPRTRKHVWDRFGTVLESEWLRTLVKAGLRRR